MLYKDDWDKSKQKYMEYWNKENHDRPIISVCAPKAGYTYKPVPAPENPLDRWMDIEYIIRSAREGFAATYFGGEAFPQLWPNLGPDIFGAILGCSLQFGENTGTSWSEHFVENWDGVKIEFNPENKWWKKIKEMTEAVAEDSKQGDYIAGITDLHPGMDGLVSLRGPENVCMDLIDNPDAIKKAAAESFAVYKKVLDELYKITTKYQEGSTHWMGVWHPGKWYSVSCDFVCMISRDMFSEFVQPALEDELKLLDASLYHLDGPGALKHLDALLAMPSLDGIQWVYGAGQPSASHWIPALKKIQDAGKLIQVNIEPHELGILLQELKPEGVMYNTYCSSEQDARDLIKMAEKAYQKKLY